VKSGRLTWTDISDFVAFHDPPARARTPSPAQLLPAPSMMLLVSLAVLSLVFPARAEVPALFTGTWRMTGMPRDDGQYLYDEFTQNANGDYTGKGWGTWSDPASGTNNYTYSGITSDGVCETDATTGAVSHRSEYTMILDYDLGANPMPSWSTPSGQKHVYCGYNTYDATTDIMTVTNYEGSETFALSADPGACPATAQEAATSLSWSAVTTETSYTYECVADCNPWACDATVLVDDAESAAVSNGCAKCLLGTVLVAGLGILEP